MENYMTMVALEFLPSYQNWEGLLGMGITRSQLKKFGYKYKKEEYKLPKEFPIDLLNPWEFSPECDEKLADEVKEIDEDEFFLCLSIPSQMHSTSLRYSERNTVFNYLRKNQKRDILDVFPHSRNRGLLNRLDYFTSGVLLFCKDEKVYQFFRKNYSECLTKKVYYAVVEGDPEKMGEGKGPFILENYFADFGLGGEKKKVFPYSSSYWERDRQYGKLSVEFQGEAQGFLSLVKIHLETGLRHQIRAQLAHAGFPLWGDHLYGGSKRKEEGFFLHAHQYSLDWKEKGYQKDFRTDLPLWVQNFSRFNPLTETFR